MFLTKLRKPIDSHAPQLAHCFRVLRDLTIGRVARKTKYGFVLAGDAKMAGATFESHEVGTFLSLLEAHDVVIDVGANVGFYSCLAASSGKHVVSFEPAHRNLKFLYQNLWSNGFSGVEVFPLGLGREAGLMQIYGFGGISSFVPGWAQASACRANLVAVTALDTIIAGRYAGQRLFVKMDVEGFELDVLSGAGKLLNQTPKPTWMIEILLKDGVIPGGVNQRFREVFEIFWSHNYHCRTLGSEPLEVTPDRVEQWFLGGSVEGGAHNFLFSGR